jgi:hypothetical protein
LEHHGITASPLHDLWQPVRDSSGEEAEFCRLAGRLGLDPYDLDDSTSGRLLALARQFEPPLLDDLSSSVSADQLDDGASWLLDGLRLLGASTAPALNAPLPASPTGVPAVGPPWSYGYALADEFRNALGLGRTERFDPGLVFRNGQSFIRAEKNPGGRL